MAGTAPNVKHGKEFEKLVSNAVGKLYLEYPSLWERVLDSHDAGNIVRKADCDFKLIVRSQTHGAPWVFHIECKASVKYSSLSDKGAAKSLVKAEQAAKLRIAHRAGIHGMILFHDVNAERVEVWNAAAVTGHMYHKADMGQPFATFPEEHMGEWFKLFIEGILDGRILFH